MTVRLESASYGKDLVRIFRIVRSPTDASSHQVIEYTARCLLSGPSLSVAWTQADNSPVVATDTIKNTLNLLAKKLPGDVVLCPEKFALHVAEHFLGRYDHIEGCEVDLIVHRWSRIVLDAADGGAHKHSFVRDGDEKRFTSLVASKAASSSSDRKPRVISLKSGVKELLVLKSSGSAFHSFWKDENTTLREVKDRIFSTAVECTYSISLPSLPLTDLVKSSLPSFCALHTSMRTHTLRIFALDASASVQATLYRMCQAILSDANNASISDVEYALPNKHYFNVDLGFAGVENVKEEEAEVFMPVAAPSGLIKAKVARVTPSKL